MFAQGEFRFLQSDDFHQTVSGDLLDLVILQQLMGTLMLLNRRSYSRHTNTG